jgi:hypothetical protein
MRIGIDFDNTIACYDGVFHKAALQQGLIPAKLSGSKNAVRDYLNGSGRKDDFTRLQGHVYGSRMDLVACYPGVETFLAQAVAAGHDCFVVSHKTRYPILGEPHDMHAAARGFLAARSLIGAAGLAAENVYFELTKEEKVARAVGLGCDVFIDDLPEILAMAGFSPSTRKILFDPDDIHASLAEAAGLERCRNWYEMADLLLRRS